MIVIVKLTSDENTNSDDDEDHCLLWYKMIVFILIIITIMVMIGNIDGDNIKTLQFRYHYIDINSKHSNNL